MNDSQAQRFRRFLARSYSYGQGPRVSAQALSDYISRARRVERLLKRDLHTAIAKNGAEAVIKEFRDKARGAIPDNSQRDCASAIRAYSQFLGCSQ